MDLNLTGRTAVVTGASKGIGLAITETLLAEGARVVATSRSRTAELDALDGELVHVPADLMDPGAPAARSSTSRPAPAASRRRSTSTTRARRPR